MSDRGVGDFSRLVRTDPKDAAQRLAAGLSREQLRALVDELEVADQAREGWALNNRQWTDNIEEHARHFETVPHGMSPFGRATVQGPRVEVRHSVRSSVWMRPAEAPASSVAPASIRLACGGRCLLCQGDCSLAVGHLDEHDGHNACVPAAIEDETLQDQWRDFRRQVQGDEGSAEP